MRQPVKNAWRSRKSGKPGGKPANPLLRCDVASGAISAYFVLQS